jgi:hypothetical protein
MADRFDLRLDGDVEFQRQLSRLQDAAARRVVMAGLREGAKAIKKTAKRNAPVRVTDLDQVKPLGKRSSRVRSAGFLKRTVIYRRVRRRLAIDVGPRRAAFYGQFFELDRKGPRSMPRRRWMTRSFSQASGAALAKIAPGMWKQLRKEIDRG